MRKFDKDGLILCKMQGQVFEMSIETTSTSSEIFIRRFMQSIIAKSLDSGDILQTNIQPKDIFERIVEQYGESKYGSVKYSPNEMYWIGYIYRYFSYTYEKSSSQVYKTKRITGIIFCLSYNGSKSGNRKNFGGKRISD